MNKNVDEKELISVNEKGLFYKIKTFFLRLFGKKESVEIKSQVEDVNSIQNNDFMERIKNIENDETRLLKLQEQYDNRLIETKDIPEDQVKALINLYKKQISELKNSNERRKAKLLAYRNNTQNA